MGIVLFVRLGMWQLDRADEKRSLIEQYEAGQRSQVELTTETADKLPHYQRVRVSGRYDPAHQILLDNMPSGRSGWPGYRVVTPLQLSDGSWQLVDRGWVPMGRTRADLPDLQVSDSERTLTGIRDTLPRAGMKMGDAAAATDAPWPRVLNFPQQPAIEQELGRKLLPGLVLLDASQPDGYERVWQAHVGIGPERHIGYAVQWFAFAVAAAVIYGLLSFRRKDPS
jgi:surfeit locus 1 family protein